MVYKKMHDEELYKENILDHYKHPRGKRAMTDFTLKGEGVNASCGDEVVIYLKLVGDRITETTFTGQGCAISQAGASMLTERLKSMTLAGAKMLSPGDIYTMLGIKVSPGRVDCALLAYGALNQALLGGSTPK